MRNEDDTIDGNKSLDFISLLTEGKYGTETSLLP